MKIYLVGGAVRDKLLGKEVQERDYVVVGATETDMEKLGFKKVGRGFPVFLHPKTNEEYALARTERKIGKGYTEFECFADPSVTLEDDLKRRDLTVNAMAEDENGNIIDPYHGAVDLKNKILHHVSDAFAEDPVRILRVARFAAKFGDFKVHDTTIILMRQMLENGEVDALVPERVWQEFVRALGESVPNRFFEVLNDCGVLQKLFPEIYAHFHCIDKTLKKAEQLSKASTIRFASIMKYLSKDALKNLSNRYKIPNKFTKLASLVLLFFDTFEKANQLTAEEILELFEKTDAFRNYDRFFDFLLACEANLSAAIFPSRQYQYLKNSLEKLQNLDLKNLLTPNLAGEEIKQKIHNARLKWLLAKH